MKLNIEDLKKAIKWIEDNTHSIILDIELEHNRYLRIKTEDKYQRHTLITIYSVDKDQKSLLKPTVQKTEQL